MNRTRRGWAGYTLMEVLAALSIIAAMASVALPAMDNFFASQRVAAEANRFIQNVRTAQYRAMETQIYHRLYFLPDGTGYKLGEYVKPAWWSAPTEVHAHDWTASNSVFWADITGEDVVAFDPAVRFFPPFADPIFFRPDGTLVLAPAFEAPLVPDCLATFSYGLSVMTVNITPIGIRSSEDFYEE